MPERTRSPVDEERRQFGDRRWALILLMSGALRSGLILPLTISLLAVGLRSAVSMAAVQSVAVGVSVVGLVLWSGWVGQLRTRPERSLGSKYFVTFGLAVLASTMFLWPSPSSTSSSSEDFMAAQG